MTYVCNWHPEDRYEAFEPFDRHMKIHHLDWWALIDTYTLRTCPTCGVIAPSSGDLPTSERCMHCPPRPCADCGEPDDRSCSCWVSVEGMSMADLKSIFAADGTFNVETDGRLTVPSSRGSGS